MRILVTSGATREPIDGVRFISNFSTGRTGAVIAETFADKGHEVTFLYGKDSVMATKAQPTHQFTSFDSLDSVLQKTLGEIKFDAVIHLAAVSDYAVAEIMSDGQRVESPTTGKLDSHDEIRILLKPNFKIIDKLREYSKNKSVIIIGFKLTNSRSQEERAAAVEKLSLRDSVDYVVHNDLSEINADAHRAQIFKKHQLIATVQNKNQLAQTLVEIVEKIKCAS